MLGQEVRMLVNENQAMGKHSVIWNGTDNSGRPVRGGIYFYQMKLNDNISVTKKMLLLNPSQ